ncbi:MAG TPA: toprim domain-containing protein [Solirubrobacteraceae bacterium]|nr:toprim domain-containing protein [Solirubrobacteraceae bacterium]
MDCPVCGEASHLVVTRKPDHDGEPTWFLHCYSASCQALGKAFLAELASAVGAPHGSWIKEDPLRWLDRDSAVSSHARPRRRGDEGWISFAQVRGWHDQLMDSWSPLDYLRKDRGLTVETIAAHLIGFDSQAFTFPVFADREHGLIRNVKRRYWPEPWKLDRNGKPVWKRGLARSASLYPDLPNGRAWLLCEGELDALLARQHGFPAVTSTTGTSWSADWNVLARGRRIAVVYDAGEASMKIAKRRAAQLRADGAADAWAVRLPLADGEDLTDWLVRHGRSAAGLRRLIRGARRSP